jgi:hypothetical protein
MRLNLEEVTRISHAIAREYDGQFEVTGVAANDGGTDHVELLVTIKGCHHDPCVLMLNLTRVDSESMERELRASLREALATHAGS